MPKPGVMLYFSIREPLSVLTLEQRGEIFSAILDYAADGIVPTFQDTLMRLAWGFIVPSLDADDQRYEQIRLKRMYATYCREAKRKGENPMSFADWMDYHVISCDNFDDQIDPVSVSNTISDSNTISVSVANTSEEPPLPTDEEYNSFCNSLGIPANKKNDWRKYVKSSRWQEVITRMWEEDKPKYKAPAPKGEFVPGDAELAAIRRMKEERQHGKNFTA